MPEYDVGKLKPTPSPERIDTKIQERAAIKLDQVFAAKGITCVFFGGFGLHLLGNKRKPGDVDCCVDVDLKTVKEKLKEEPE